MTIDQALNILQPMVRTMSGLKQAHRQFVLKYHPDRNPGYEELMKLGNAANDKLKETYHIWAVKEYKPESGSQETPIDEEIDKIYKTIKHFPGIEINLAGTWIWVTGETKLYKEEFKQLGFSWCNKKKAWAWKPADYKCKYRKNAWSFDKIYQTYGRQELLTEEYRKVA